MKINVNYIKELEDFEVKIGNNILYIKPRKIIYFIEQLNKGLFNLNDYLDRIVYAKIINDPQELLLDDYHTKILCASIEEAFLKNRKIDVDLIFYKMIEKPDKHFLDKGSEIIIDKLKDKWVCLEDAITINSIIIDVEIVDVFPRDFIAKEKELTPKFIDGLKKILEIDSKNHNKINFFIVKQTQSHSFLVIKVLNNIFMFDSVGQKYGTTKKYLGIKQNAKECLELEEISYTSMFLELLKENKELNLYFNINPLQQDITNCFTFAIDFLDGFCEEIEKNDNFKILENFNDYLTKFFPITLPENMQIHHEGAIGVMYDLMKDGYRDEDQVYSRPMLPYPLLRTSQLNSTFLKKAEAISPKSTEDVKLEPVLVRESDGSIKGIQTNKRIYAIRKQQEKDLLKFCLFGI